MVCGATCRFVGRLLLEAAGDLRGGPVLGQTLTDDLVAVGPFQLLHQRPLATTLLGLRVRLRRVIHGAAGIARQLARDRRWMPAQYSGNFLLCAPMAMPSS
jgi:hypothetical protein